MTRKKLSDINVDSDDDVAVLENPEESSNNESDLKEVTETIEKVDESVVVAESVVEEAPVEEVKKEKKATIRKPRKKASKKEESKEIKKTTNSSEGKRIGNYFVSDKDQIQFIPSGCGVMDLVLGGGYAIGRVVNIVGDRSSGKCVLKNTYISTGSGINMIGVLGESFGEGASDYVESLSLKNDEVVETDKFWKETVDHTIKVTDFRGYTIEGTPDHKIQVWKSDCTTEMVKLSDIKESDVLTMAFPKNQVANEVPLVQKSYKFSNNDSNGFDIKIPESLNSDLASLLGIMVADGCYKSMAVGSSKKWVENELLRTSACLLPSNESSLFRKKESDDRVPSFEFRTIRVKRFFEDAIWGHSLDNETGRFKTIPKAILQSPNHVQASFLKALMSCDAWYDGNTHMEFYTASAELVEQVKMMLLHQGIACSHYIKNNVKGYEGHDYHSLSITGNYFKRYINKIGSFKYDGVLPEHNRGNASGSNSIPYLNEKLNEDIESWKIVTGWSKNGKMKNVPDMRFMGRSRVPELLKNDLTKTVLEDFVAHYAVPEFKDTVDISEYKEILNNNYFYTKVKTIEHKYEEVEVFDVRVPDGHLFWANGFVSHNTLLGIESMANFINKFPNGDCYYIEAESAFDIGYAEALGMPVEHVEIKDNILTIEQLNDDLMEILEKSEENPDKPILYIVDSLDALSDEAELKRKMTDGSFGAAKAKKLSEMFRRLVKKMGKGNVTLFIISQVRDNIGVTFGSTKTRSGGKALDFYASQVVWLAEIKKHYKTKKGVKRVVGVQVKAQCKKNKVGLPFRDAEYPIHFGFGIDNITASIEWLDKVDGGKVALEEFLDGYGITLGKVQAVNLRKINALDDEEYKSVSLGLDTLVKQFWNEIETDFLPTRRKY